MHMNREYISRDAKAPNPTTRLIGLAVGFILIALSIIRKSIYSTMIGVVLIAALAMVKVIKMDEEGLVTTYDIAFIKRKDIWRYDEIEEIHKELSPNGREMALHVRKGIMSKRLIYPVETYRSVIDLALEKNPDIHVAYVDK